ncbi:hypothetical protein HDU93_006078, partial [Gonapodya sp. JEL0774]
GWTVASWSESKQEWGVKSYHVVVAEHAQWRNGIHVADARDSFAFGATATLSLKPLVKKLKAAIAKADYLVAHAASSDETLLRRIGVPIKSKTVLDTQVMARAVLLATSASATSTPAALIHPPRLSTLLTHLAVPYDPVALHNAGNDARYTMEAFLKMGKMANGVWGREVAGRWGVEWDEVVGTRKEGEGE